MDSPSPHDGSNETDHILRPRPMKPSNPMILRAMSEERGSSLKPNGHVESQVPSGISRCEYSGHLPTLFVLIYILVVAQRLFRRMLFPPKSPYPLQGNKYALRTSTGCSRQ